MEIRPSNRSFPRGKSITCPKNFSADTSHLLDDVFDRGMTPIVLHDAQYSFNQLQPTSIGQEMSHLTLSPLCNFSMRGLQ